MNNSTTLIIIIIITTTTTANNHNDDSSNDNDSIRVGEASAGTAVVLAAAALCWSSQAFADVDDMTRGSKRSANLFSRAHEY